MRLPYAPATAPAETASPSPQLAEPSAAEAYAQLSARRAPEKLQPLDLALLHSPSVAVGWSSFLGAIRTQTSLPVDIRELCICRVAVLNGAAYEWEQHAPILKSEGGLSEEAVEEVKQRKAWRGWDDVVGEKGNEPSDAETVGGLNRRQGGVLAYCDAMTISVKVGDEIFATLRRVFAEKEVMEITATVAAYNCVSRFLVALDIGETSAKNEAMFHR